MVKYIANGIVTRPRLFQVYVKRWNVSLEYIAYMRLSVVECIWTSLEYICTKIHDILKKHDILSQQETEKEGDETRFKRQTE